MRTLALGLNRDIGIFMPVEPISKLKKASAHASATVMVTYVLHQVKSAIPAITNKGARKRQIAIVSDKVKAKGVKLPAQLQNALAGLVDKD